jgi:hypothetical protein
MISVTNPEFDQILIKDHYFTPDSFEKDSLVLTRRNISETCLSLLEMIQSSL